MPSMMMPKRPNPIEAYSQQLFQMLYQKKLQDEQYAKQREESKTRYEWEADKEKRREEALQHREDAAIRKADLMLKAKQKDAKTKTTLGTAYTNKEGKRVRPVFDYQNKFIRDEEIGTPETKVKESPTERRAAELQKSKDLAMFNQKLKESFGNLPDTLNKNQLRNLGKALAEMETTVALQPENEGVKPSMYYINRWSDKPSIYIWKETKKSFGRISAKAEQVKLPVVNGKQLTAEDVWATAKETYGAATDEYIKKVLAALGIEY